MATLGGSDEGLGIGLPDERLGLCGVRLEKGVDRLLEVDEGVADAGPESSSDERFRQRQADGL